MPFHGVAQAFPVGYCLFTQIILERNRFHLYSKLMQRAAKLAVSGV